MVGSRIQYSSATVPKAVIFDIGGVLADDVWEHLFFDNDGIVVRWRLGEAQARAVGERLWEQFAYRSAGKQKDWKGQEREYWATFIEECGIHVSENELIRLSDAFIRAIPGMRDVLEHVRSVGIDLAICSNNTEFWFRRQMDKLDLARFFSDDKVVLSSRLGTSKSDSSHKMFQAVVDALKVDRSECVFVDDKDENVLRALEFGMTGILFPSHSRSGSRYLEAVLGRIDIFGPSRASIGTSGSGAIAPIDKDRCDALAHLADDRWREFELKAQQEWKLSLSIWTALAIGVASLLTGEIPQGRLSVVGGVPLVLGVLCLVVFVAALHFAFLSWVQERMNQIRESMDEIDRARRLFAGVQKTGRYPIRSPLRQAPLWIQVAITGLLGLSLLLMLLTAL